MMWRRIQNVFTVYLMTVFIVSEFHRSLGLDCPYACICNETKVNCTNRIPETLTNAILEVILFNPTRDILFPRAFCKASWPDVLQLIIQITSEELFLVDGVFDCLNFIQTLKIQNDEGLIVRLYRNTFKGLHSVSVLNLEDCSRTTSKEIHISLSKKDVLPKLSKLILVGVSRAYDAFQWTQNFTNMLGYRNITEINLSYTIFNIYTDDFTLLCNTLEKLNLSEAFILDSKLNDEKPCPSLKSIDISGTHFPKAKPLPKRITLTGIRLSIGERMRSLYENVATLFANKLISTDHVIWIKNSTFDFLAQNALHELYCNYYNVPYFDVEFKISPDHLAYLDMSSNSIETIGPHVFRNLVQLRRLTLSNNTLSKCNSFERTFSVLFQNNTNLEELNIANNGLFYLPTVTFVKNTNLQRLDLSNNLLEKITFDVSHMKHITELDLKNNKIELLDSSTMKTLDQLYKNKLASRTEKKNETLVVNLHGNPLKCNCFTLRFVEWFIRTPVFNLTKHLYQCESEGRCIAINAAAVAEAREDCEKPIRRRRLIILCSILPTLSIISVISVTFLIVRRNRKRVAYQRFEETVRRLRDGVDVFEFPVFLSYSSEDQSLVMNHILQPLQVCLQSTVGTNMELVWTGDRCFRPGRSLFTEITRCLENCALVVAVMSQNFCRSLYCKMEIDEARIRGKPVIMIFIEEVDESEMSEVMKEIFRNFARIKMVPEGEGYQPQPSWPIVCQSIIQVLQES